MSSSNLIGRRLGSYQITQLLGEGGMGAVYASYQTTVKRQVAIKVLPAHLAQNPGYIERFNREVELAAKMEHPHILPVHDYGSDNGTSYIVMRLLTGGSLEQRLARFGTPAPAETIEILRQIGGALDYAHRRGVVHRDLKASNVLFDEDGNAYLTDFGIAKALEGHTGLTSTGQVLGTPAYMAPEQWRGDYIDGRADVYALAVMTYHMLTGQLPFDAPTPYAMMHKHLSETAKAPNLLSPSVPPAVNLVLEKGLAKEVENRYPTASAFVADLEAALGAGGGLSGVRTGFLQKPLPRPSPMPGVAFPTSPAGQTGQTQLGSGGDTRAGMQAQARGGGSRGWLFGVVVVLALVGGLLIFLGLQSGQDDEPRDDENVIAVASATPTLTETPTETPIATRTPTATVTPTPSPTQTISPTATPSPGIETRAALYLSQTAAAASPTPSPNLTETESAEMAVFFASQTAVVPGTATPFPASVTPLVVAAVPTGDWDIVFASDRDGDNEIYVMNISSGEVLQLTFNGADDNAPSWSPDRRSIVFESNLRGDYDIYIMNVDGSNARQITDNAFDDWGPSFSPDGTRLAFHSARNGTSQVFVMDVDGDNARQVSDGGRPFARSASWSPDGTQLVYMAGSTGTGRDLFISTVDGSSTRLLTPNDFWDGLPDWSSTGQIVFGSTRISGDDNLFIMDANGENVRQLTFDPAADVDPSWSPDASQIVFESDDGGDWELWVINADGTGLRQLTSNRANDISADW